MKKRTIGRLFVMLLAIGGMGGVACANNLLVNGDAEKGPAGKTPPGWACAAYDAKANAKTTAFPPKIVAGGHSGKKAIALTLPDKLEWTYAQQIITIKPDRLQKCALTVWLKADKELSQSVDLVLLPASKAASFREARERVDVGTSWKPYSVSVDVRPSLDSAGKPQAQRVRVIVQLYGKATLFIDDAELTLGAFSSDEKAEVDTVHRIEKTYSAYACPVSRAGGFVGLPGGRILAFNSNFTMCESTDGAKTWTDPEKLEVPEKTGILSGVIRMKNGTIGIWTESWGGPMYFWKSKDNGKTWSKRIKMGRTGAPLHGQVMTETTDGRLLIPARMGHTVPERLYTGAYGTVDGKRVKVEGHAHQMEMDYTFVYYSTNGGDSWKRSQGDIIIWKDDGYGGMWPCDEPSIAELRDGRLLMFVRTMLGRLYQTVSPDGGKTWDYPEPTALPSSYSPCILNRIPDNEATRKSGRAGDLLCIWNNVSADEIKRGWRRGRLSSAISTDDGKTWQHVRTIDTGGLPPLDSPAPLCEPGMARADKELGELPMPFALVSYPDVAFVGNDVLVKYLKDWVNPNVDRKMKLRVLPLDWFYGKD